MKIIRKISDLRSYLKTQLRRHPLGFVPTMGDLHEGHLSLIRRSKKENKLTAVSIFVNPSQFNNKEDFKKYFRNEKADLKALKKEGVDLVFLPKAEELYPEGFQTWVQVENLSQGLCGNFRPGHFKGVATVVLKLFQLVQPNVAYFGLKDYQQFKIIERMVDDLNLSVRLVPCPTVREADGLALSSRNRRLSSEERQRAAHINLALRSLSSMIKSGRVRGKSVLENRFLVELKLTSGDKLEYLEFLHPKMLTPLKLIQSPALIVCSVWIGGTRLIDNIFMGTVPFGDSP